MSELDQVVARLRDDTLFWARELEVKIENEVGQKLALDPRWAQQELVRRMDEQRAAGGAVRALVGKSRKTGVSTMIELRQVQKVSMIENRVAYTIAQDVATAGKMDKIAWRAYTSLPNDPRVKPPLRNRNGGCGFELGEKSRKLQELGELGHNSSYEVQTAKEAEKGRGYTIHDFHGSEVAFWPDITRKLLAVRNAVPDDPDTSIVLESTANGFNEWKKEWDRAEAGKSEYIAVFIPWWRDPMCWRQIVPDERDAFIETIGSEDEEELRLIELAADHDVVLEPEQLAWRRGAIENKTGGDRAQFRQEYPASPEEAFIATGGMVFGGVMVSKAIDAARAEPLPEKGVLKVGDVQTVHGRVGQLEVPTEALWVPQGATGFAGNHDFWHVWEHPRVKGEPDPVTGDPIERDGRYVAALDPADPDESTKKGAAHGLTVIDHETRQLVAELETWMDPDLAGVQLLLAALRYNHAIVAVETTGGYGGSIARWLYLDVNYPRLYFRRQMLGKKERMEERLGWDTSRISKVLLEDMLRTALREGNHGIRSLRLALQLTTYVRRGVKSGPQEGYLADLLMSFMIAQYVAAEEPVPPDEDEAGAFSMLERSPAAVSASASGAVSMLPPR